MFIGMTPHDANMLVNFLLLTASVTEQGVRGLLGILVEGWVTVGGMTVLLEKTDDGENFRLMIEHIMHRGGPAADFLIENFFRVFMQVEMPISNSIDMEEAAYEEDVILLIKYLKSTLIVG
jgi:hypothetical protein